MLHRFPRAARSPRHFLVGELAKEGVFRFCPDGSLRIRFANSKQLPPRDHSLESAAQATRHFLVRHGSQ